MRASVASTTSTGDTFFLAMAAARSAADIQHRSVSFMAAVIVCCLSVKFDAPLDRYRDVVRPEWIDHNRHMNVGYYLVGREVEHDEVVAHFHVLVVVDPLRPYDVPVTVEGRREIRHRA